MHQHEAEDAPGGHFVSCICAHAHAGESCQRTWQWRTRSSGRAFQSLQRLVASLADSLNRPLPQLQETTTRLTSEGGVTLISKQVNTAP